MRRPSYCQEALVPCNPEQTADFKVPETKSSPFKECLHRGVKPHVVPGVAASNVAANNNIRGVHNKENHKEHDRTLDEVSLGCELFEDSGYLSLQNSHIDHNDNDYEAEEQSSAPSHLQQDETKAAYSISSTPASLCSDPNLPILKFQRAVCKELAKSFQRSQTYDWSVIDKVAQKHCLDRVIGGQMGREFVDVFSSLLERDMKHVLTRILGLLGEQDLISFKNVSRTWRKIICEDQSALQRCQLAEQKLKDTKDSLNEENAVGLTRDMAMSRVVMSSIQTLATTSFSSSHKSSRTQKHHKASTQTKGPQPTRFREFQEAASRIKQEESLRPCKHCGGPAKHQAAACRATCIRLSCLFDFCTLCLGPFHGASSCRTVQPRGPCSARATPLLAGSARSKRNVRRL
ncbi:F-box only protein 5 [Aplochiton taeniatus]